VPEDAIQKDSTIYHLGLDSILVLKLPALLKKDGIQLNVSDVLRDQSVRAIALSADGKTANKAEVVDYKAVTFDALSSTVPEKALRSLGEDIQDIDFIMPVTAGQLYMIRMWQTSQGILFYPSFTHTIYGKFNERDLRNAWKELLRRHDILRTGFIQVGSEVLQGVFKHFPNELKDERGLSRSPKNPDDLGEPPPDLRKPPISLSVVESTESAMTLKLHIHHALYDGISLPILFTELECLYQGQTLGSPYVSFKTFVKQSIYTLESHACHGKWKAYLGENSSYQQLRSNPGRPGSPKRTEVLHQSRKISPLDQIARRYGVSVDALLLATTAVIYSQHLQAETSTSPVDQIILGVYLANRAPFGEDLSLLVAPTLNLLPLRVRNPSSRPIEEVAKEIQSDLYSLSSAEMSCASLEQIYEWTGVRVDFFVNILKDATAEIKETRREAQVVEYVPNEEISAPTNGGCDAYLVRLSLFHHL
jgi:aryl carrier-like protein